MAQVIYVYVGPGASAVSCRLLESALLRCVCPRSYSVQNITPTQIKAGGWQERCAALVLGGGYDKGYLRSLGKEGADMVRNFVLNGGTYIGMCAGAYFACDYIEFEKGSSMEVQGYRPLKFYPGKSMGSIVPNFQYNTERGAAALPLAVPANVIPGHSQPSTFHAYVNGGGCFSQYTTSDMFPQVRNVETLASCDSLAGKPAAVVKCEIGDKGGVAILSHPHIEFAAFELSPSDKYLVKIMRDLRNSDRSRERLFMSFLAKGNLRLRVNASL